MYTLVKTDELFASLNVSISELNNLLGSKYVESQKLKVRKLYQEYLVAYVSPHS